MKTGGFSRKCGLSRKTEEGASTYSAGEVGKKGGSSRTEFGGLERPEVSFIVQQIVCRMSKWDRQRVRMKKQEEPFYRSAEERETHQYIREIKVKKPGQRQT